MKKILHYDIGEKLGEGKNGPTYVAWDPGQDRAVTIKLLTRGSKRDHAWQAAYLDEIALTNRIGSDRIANVFSLEEVDGRLLIIREYVQGESIKNLAAGEPVGFKQFLHIAVGAAKGLMDLQPRRMVHRNINSGNLIYAREGLVKLLDNHLDAVDRSVVSSEDLTFLAPEQIQGGPADHRSDLYSLGVVLYHLMTGQLPYASTETSSLKEAILSGEGLFSEAEGDRFPGDARLLIENLMAVDPADRFAGADQLLLTLREMLHFAEVESGGVIEDRPKWTARQYLGVSLLVLLFVVLWFVLTVYNR